MKNITVIKISGKVLSSLTKRREIFKNIVKYSKNNHIVIVHGGKEQINNEKFGGQASSGPYSCGFKIKPKFVCGQRYTDEATLKIVSVVLNKVNETIVNEINLLGGKAVGLSGIDGKTIIAKQTKKLGYVGRVKSVDTQLLKLLISNNYIPVINPVSAGRNGELLNLNADVVASAVAVALHSSKLIFISDVPGILNRDKKLIPLIRPKEIEKLKRENIILDGMLPKVEGCLLALKKGVGRIYITNSTDFANLTKTNSTCIK